MTKNPKTVEEAVKMFRPFVIREARRRANKSGADVEDLTQQGLLAVARAFKTWRKKKGANFLTYIHRPVFWQMSKLIAEHRRRGLTGTKREKNGRVEKARMASFDAPVGENFGDVNEQMTLHDVIGTFDEPPDCFALERLAAAMTTLSTRERDVIRMRFTSGMKLQQVGDRFGLSRERIRQIETDAIDKLRAAIFAKEKRPS